MQRAKAKTKKKIRNNRETDHINYPRSTCKKPYRYLWIRNKYIRTIERTLIKEPSDLWGLLWYVRLHGFPNLIQQRLLQHPLCTTTTLQLSYCYSATIVYATIYDRVLYITTICNFLRVFYSINILIYWYTCCSSVLARSFVRSYILYTLQLYPIHIYLSLSLSLNISYSLYLSLYLNIDVYLCACLSVCVPEYLSPIIIILSVQKVLRSKKKK